MPLQSLTRRASGKPPLSFSPYFSSSLLVCGGVGLETEKQEVEHLHDAILVLPSAQTIGQEPNE
eukprot:2039347-Amphidinium_carterae.1